MHPIVQRKKTTTDPLTYFTKLRQKHFRPQPPPTHDHMTRLSVGTGFLGHDDGDTTGGPTASHNWSKVESIIPKLWIHSSSYEATPTYKGRVFPA